MLSWGLVVRLGCSPLVRFWWILGMYTLLWAYMLIGAAIFMTIENPTRREPAATNFLQGEINYSEAVYFTMVFVTTCGLGDIIPITDGGRALVCVWSFVGTALWLALLTSIVSFLCDYVYVEIILNAYWYLHRRRLQQKKTTSSDDKTTPDLEALGSSTASTISTTSTQSQAQADQVRASGGKPDNDPNDEGDDEDDDVSDDSDSDIDDDGDDVEKAETKKKEAGEEGQDAAQTWKEHMKDRSLMNETLSWRSLLTLNVVALTLYFVVHIICTGVFFGLEPHMGWLGEKLTPSSYATYFYASFTYSQTICFGTDYAPKTASGRAFFVVWQQLNYITATFLFSTVAMAIIRYSRAKIAFVLERVMERTYGPKFRRTMRRMSRRGSAASQTTAAG